MTGNANGTSENITRTGEASEHEPRISAYLLPSGAGPHGTACGPEVRFGMLDRRTQSRQRRLSPGGAGIVRVEAPGGCR